MVGWTDLPADLSDSAALDRLSRHLPVDAPVVSSDLSRARATADAITGARRRLPDVPDLREMHFGAWENRTFNDVQSTDPDRILAFWSDPGPIAAPGGESWNDIAARVGDAADALARTGGDVIVVAHFGAILTQVARARGQRPKDALGQYIDNLSVTRIRFDGTAWHAGKVNHRP